MLPYNIYTPTEKEKYKILELIRAAGAVITGVSGCGTGYYIQIDATPDQVTIINNRLSI
jgi:hypothetical protein